MKLSVHGRISDVTGLVLARADTSYSAAGMLELRQRRPGCAPGIDTRRDRSNRGFQWLTFATIRRASRLPGSRTDADIDEGLRAYMLKVYNLMALGLVITGVAASALISLATTNPASAVATLATARCHGLAPLLTAGCRDARSAGIGVLPELPHPHDERLGRADAFWVYRRPDGPVAVVDLPGLHGAEHRQTFFVTAAAFGALSLYGYTTKRDLTAMGSFLIMGVFGLIIAMVVNIFLQSSAHAVRHLGDRRADLRGPDRLRHAEDQGDVFRRRRACSSPAARRSWAR